MEVLLPVATHLIIDDDSTTISSNDKRLNYDMMIVNDKLNIFIPMIFDRDEDYVLNDCVRFTASIIRYFCVRPQLCLLTIYVSLPFYVSIYFFCLYLLLKILHSEMVLTSYLLSKFVSTVIGTYWRTFTLTMYSVLYRCGRGYIGILSGPEYWWRA